MSWAQRLVNHFGPKKKRFKIAYFILKEVKQILMSGFGGTDNASVLILGPVIKIKALSICR
jgi:hypothetical protein